MAVLLYFKQFEADPRKFIPEFYSVQFWIFGSRNLKEELVNIKFSGY